MWTACPDSLKGRLRTPQAYARNAGATPKLTTSASALYSPTEAAEKYGEADRARGVFEIGVAAFEGGQDGVIAAEKIGDRKRTGKKIRAALRRFANGSAAVFVWVI